MTPSPTTSPPRQLHRTVGVVGATMMGLGSIVGTGVFVSIGLGAGIAGPAVVLAIALAGVLALCNGLSSAQLAAAHPVSGGTYEYGYRLLSPAIGFTAGWTFLAAKSASAATAALGAAAYLFPPTEGDDPLAPLRDHQAAVATAIVALLTLLVLTGLRRTNAANIAIVSVTLVALALFVTLGAPTAANHGGDTMRPLFHNVEGEPFVVALLHATALMFVAYTGYGRIATLGEEIREPQRNIPRAILVTLAVSAALYVGVALVAVAAVGPEVFYETTRHDAAPLAIIAGTFAGGVSGWLPWVISAGAVTAMLGVLLNLILGLSRVALAMGRRGDLPSLFSHVSGPRGTPTPAVVAVGAVIAALAMLGSVKAAWSFSAFTVLVYYGLTNLAALRLPPPQRLYPRAFAVLGLVGCVSLAFFVEPVYWGAGLALIAIGLAWHGVCRRRGGSGSRGG